MDNKLYTYYTVMCPFCRRKMEFRLPSPTVLDITCTRCELRFQSVSIGSYSLRMYRCWCGLGLNHECAHQERLNRIFYGCKSL